ncbi:MAG: dioxygenase [Bdellovibrionales bacterium]|nr:dioxygenase [Bdellovibrionales bacterium]
MSSYRFPAVFLSHGTPMTAFAHEHDPYQDSLLGFARSIPKPKAILFVSAHSLSSDQVHILKCDSNSIQHDFAGFPKELYEMTYSCPGSPPLADEAANLFRQAGFGVKIEPEGPLDHGIWVPLLHLYPKGDVPVVRVSLPINMLPAQILKMGHTLAALREQGVLLVGSGGAVHNLRELQWSGKHSSGAGWALEFEQWLISSLKSKNVEAILHFEDHPGFQRSHPSDEHFLPILFTVGAALPGDEAEILFQGIQYGTLSMLCFSLNPPKTQILH